MHANTHVCARPHALADYAPAASACPPRMLQTLAPRYHREGQRRHVLNPNQKHQKIEFSRKDTLLFAIRPEVLIAEKLTLRKKAKTVVNVNRVTSQPPESHPAGNSW